MEKLLGAEVNKPVGFAENCKLLFLHFIWRLQNGLLFLSRKLLYSASPKNPKQILIFRTGSLGDSICALPAIKAIAHHYPAASLDILTNAGRKNLVGLATLLPDGLYRDCIDYQDQNKKNLLKNLRKKKYDLVIQLPQVDASFFRLVRDLILFRLVASAGFGWQVNQLALFRKAQAKHLVFPNEITRLQHLFFKNGIIVAEQKTILNPGSQDIQIAKEWLVKAGVEQNVKLIAIVVGAKRTQNRWPIEYFEKVIEHFANAYTIILIGSSEDNPLVQSLLYFDNIKNACGQLTPLQSAALLSFCKLTISNDTGPMHLSYAVGTPTIALYSGRDLPGKWYPPASASNSVFRTPIHCQACFTESCLNNICMKQILPTQVIKAAQQILKN